MNELKIFENSEFGKIRTLTIESEPWFVGRDVADILGYKDLGTAILDHVEDEDRKPLRYKAFGVLYPTLWDKENDFSNKIVISEAGVYSLIFGSKLPTAKQFKRWVTSEVLPSIRKTGGYIAGQEQLTDDELLEQALLVAHRRIAEREAEVEKLKTTNAVQSQQLAEMKPKATYYDLVLQCKDLVSVTQVAKDYGKTARWLNTFLADKKIQFMQSGVWILYSKYADKGYTNTKTGTYTDNNGEMHSKAHTYWTQKGRLFLYDLLKSEGYLPTVEKQRIEATGGII